MFRTTPSLTPDQFRWLKELRSRASLVGFDIPQPVRGQLEAMNYIEDRDGKATVTRPGAAALGSYREPPRP
ncbi:hypothetical protein [Bordetella bronchialis]|uniref:Uncharacterized protein n=1 Tax=Bordetella bronchialis TaxID=463025 RepID=A0A193FGT4_9BORD|nr:hypothetical protein [Bordetella bronchialis]ANN66406.1 hypothetical protein BAU06_08980 [Bordetella bronchialis]ANN71486.1 hypothetical protein BAU08_09200 [Bordetella bronchialis]